MRTKGSSKQRSLVFYKHILTHDHRSLVETEGEVDADQLSEQYNALFLQTNKAFEQFGNDLIRGETFTGANNESFNIASIVANGAFLQLPNDAAEVFTSMIQRMTIASVINLLWSRYVPFGEVRFRT